MQVTKGKSITRLQCHSYQRGLFDQHNLHNWAPNTHFQHFHQRTLCASLILLFSATKLPWVSNVSMISVPTSSDVRSNKSLAYALLQWILTRRLEQYETSKAYIFLAQCNCSQKQYWVNIPISVHYSTLIGN